MPSPVNAARRRLARRVTVMSYWHYGAYKDSVTRRRRMTLHTGRGSAVNAVAKTEQ
ncbi:hypothetical protein GCM10009678_47300 [Actinomadura kijaniata]